jgi:hypothetical protein
MAQVHREHTPRAGASARKKRIIEAMALLFRTCKNISSKLNNLTSMLPSLTEGRPQNELQIHVFLTAARIPSSFPGTVDYCGRRPGGHRGIIPA